MIFCRTGFHKPKWNLTQCSIKTKTINFSSVATFTQPLANPHTCSVSHLHSQIQAQMACVNLGYLFSTDLIVAGLQQLILHVLLLFFTVANGSCVTHLQLQQVLNIAVGKQTSQNSLHKKEGCVRLRDGLLMFNKCSEEERSRQCYVSA